MSRLGEVTKSIEQAAPARALVRAATAHVLNRARGRNEGPEEIARQAWPADKTAQALINKAATVPATTTLSGWASELSTTAVSAFVSGLAPLSAASALINAGVRLSFDGAGNIIVPYANPNSPTTSPLFVAEAAPIPVGRLYLLGSTLTPRKMALISVFTRQVAQYSVGNAEAIIGQAMRESCAFALDAAIFSSAAASALRPAGILAGLSSVAISGATTIEDAMVADIGAAVSAIHTAGGGSSIMIFASPAQAVAIGLRAGPAFKATVVPTRALSAGTVVVVDPAGFASAFDSEPEFDASTEAAIHFDDSVPLELVQDTTSDIIAAPIGSLFQADLMSLKLILRTSWTVRQPGLVQLLNVDW